MGYDHYYKPFDFDVHTQMVRKDGYAGVNDIIFVLPWKDEGIRLIRVVSGIPISVKHETYNPALNGEDSYHVQGSLNFRYYADIAEDILREEIDAVWYNALLVRPFMNFEYMLRDDLYHGDNKEDDYMILEYFRDLYSLEDVFPKMMPNELKVTNIPFIHPSGTFRLTNPSHL